MNGGDRLLHCINLCLTQEIDDGFEVIVIDSESNDGTQTLLSELASRDSRVIFHPIKRRDFGHGKTRNLGASIARGELVCFLTQDALPANKRWLASYSDAFACYPYAWGAFGRHVAHREHGAYADHCLERHFATFGHTAARHRIDDIILYEKHPALRQRLHFYSDNNSCMRKSAWHQIPYPSIRFGEDQAWADLVLRRGRSIVYVPDAVVAHSHAFTVKEAYVRAKEESTFFREHFGYTRKSGILAAIQSGLHLTRKESAFWRARGRPLSLRVKIERLALHLAHSYGQLEGFHSKHCITFPKNRV